jgi:predicted DNA-binding transcriptional regulator AlpA
VPVDFAMFVEQWSDKRFDKAEILKRCDMSESTFYRKRAQLQGKTQ